MNKHIGKTAAAIVIGSNSVRMHVAQWNGRRTVALDRLEKPISIGREVFTSGYLSFGTVRELSAILSGFLSVAREYDVARIQTTATTALREAVNQAYVLDHLAIQNNLEVQVLEDGQVNLLLFDSMRERAAQSGLHMLVYGGTGTINFALLQDSRVQTTQSMNTGLVKLAEILRESSAYSTHIDHVAKEYLQTWLLRNNRMQEFGGVGSIVFGMGEMRPLFELFGHGEAKERAMVRRNELLKAYEECRSLSIDRFSERVGLDHRRGGAAYAAMTLLALLLEITQVPKLQCVRADLADALLELQLRPGARRSLQDGLRADTMAAVYYLSRRYHCDPGHARHVSGLALSLFEQLRKVHGLSRRQSLLLQAACVLHECGYYTNTADMQEATYDLVKDAQIFGLKARDTLLVANIIAPQSLLGVDRRSGGQGTLTGDEVLFVAKMHALLHLADALDYSRRQKAVLQGVELEGNRLTLLLLAQDDFSLEQWMFRQSASLFQEVFGLELYLELESARMEGNR